MTKPSHDFLHTARAWHRPTLALLLVASAYPFFIGLLAPRYMNDDAYITLTYARAIAEGKGFVYNHGPATFGTTTPLQALLLAGVARALPMVPLDAAAFWLSALWAALTPWPLYLARRAYGLGDWPAAFVGLAMLCFVYWYPYGMEAHLFALLTVLSVSLYFAGARHAEDGGKSPTLWEAEDAGTRPTLREPNRPRSSGFAHATTSARIFAAGLCLGLLVLTRGEGALIALLLGIYGFVPLLRTPADWRVLLPQAIRTGALLTLGFAVVTAPWLIYATITFGGPLPDTLAAKRIQGALGGELFRDRIFPRMLEWGTYIPHAAWVGAVFQALALLGLYTSLRHAPRLLLFFLWAAGYIAAYAALGVAWYWWYDLAPYTVWTLFVGLGLAQATAWLYARAPAQRRGMLVSAIALGFAVVSTLGVIAETIHAPGYVKGAIYRNAAEYLRAHVAPGERVAAAEAGYLGYFGRVHLLDLYGLTDPKSLAYFAQGNPAGAFWAEHPGWLVAFEEEHPWSAIRKDPRFDAEYEQVWEQPHEDPQLHLLIFRRRG